MDVRCERCQTEYEVEDSSVSDLGTEVQCSDCGHLFTVKRPATGGTSASTAAMPGTSEGEAGWKVLTALGQTHDLRDLTQLHKWIIERRVTRDDKISRDGRAWQTLGSMSELVPFFDIVDSAERARALEALPDPPPAPLQPRILIQPVRPAAEAKQSSTAGATSKLAPSAGSAGDSLGALPQAADAGETEMIRAEASRRGRFSKLAIMATVAAGIGYGGIVWQRHHLRPAVISSSGNTDDQQAHAQAAVPPPTVPAATSDEPAQAGDEDDHAHGPVVEPLDQSAAEHAARSAAARAYVALGHRQFSLAIKLFKRELAQSPINGTALFGLAEAYRGAGLKVPALQAYRRYVEILPFGPDAGSARFQIRNLEARLRR